jgi:hypothetical protein
VAVRKMHGAVVGEMHRTVGEVATLGAALTWTH